MAFDPLAVISHQVAQRQADKLGIDIRDPSRALAYDIECASMLAECGQVFQPGISRVFLFPEDVTHISRKLLRDPSDPKVAMADAAYAAASARDARGQGSTVRPSFEAAYYSVADAHVRPVISLREASLAPVETVQIAAAEAPVVEAPVEVIVEAPAPVEHKRRS